MKKIYKLFAITLLFVVLIYMLIVFFTAFFNGHVVKLNFNTVKEANLEAFMLVGIFFSSTYLLASEIKEYKKEVDNGK